MSDKDNVETLINQIYAHEPEAWVVISDNQRTLAILDKKGWENDDFSPFIRAMCRSVIPPRFLKRLDIPVIGTAIYINLSECEKIAQ